MDRESIIRFIREWRVGSWALGAGSAATLVLAISLLFAYALPSDWTVTQGVRGILPLPVATVGMGSAASYWELSDNLSSVRRFYETQDFASIGMRVDFATDDGKMRLKMREKEILNKMIEDEALRVLAKKRGIVITSAEATKEVANQLEKAGGKEEDVRSRLLRLYGWNMDEFKEKVILPGLYEKNLRERFESDASQFASAKARAQAARQFLDDGRSFADTAREFSDGKTASEGGAMGWFAYGDLIAELQEPAKTQKTGDPGSVVESPLGFHILLVDERKTEKGAEYVRLSQIFSKKKTFGDWLSEELGKMNVSVLAPEYEWNRDTARVEFSDAELREFERKALENSDGDASVF